MFQWTRIIIASQRSVLDATLPAALPFRFVKIGDITYRGSGATLDVPSRVVVLAFDDQATRLNCFRKMLPRLKPELVNFAGLTHFILIA